MNKTTFLDFVGYCPKTRVWDYLLTLGELDFSKNDIIEGTDIKKEKVEDIVKWLIENNLIIKSRKLKKIQLYKLNMKDKRIKTFYKLDTYCMVLDKRINKIMEENNGKKSRNI